MYKLTEASYVKLFEFLRYPIYGTVDIINCIKLDKGLIDAIEKKDIELIINFIDDSEYNNGLFTKEQLLELITDETFQIEPVEVVILSENLFGIYVKNKSLSENEFKIRTNTELIYAILDFSSSQNKIINDFINFIIDFIDDCGYDRISRDEFFQKVQTGEEEAIEGIIDEGYYLEDLLITDENIAAIKESETFINLIKIYKDNKAKKINNIIDLIISIENNTIEESSRENFLSSIKMDTFKIEIIPLGTIYKIRLSDDWKSEIIEYFDKTEWRTAGEDL